MVREIRYKRVKCLKQDSRFKHQLARIRDETAQNGV